MQILKRVRPHEKLPPFYWPYRHDFATNEWMAAPIPLNFIIGIWFAFASAVRWGWKSVLSDPRAAYNQGFEDGKKKNESE